MIPYVVGKLAPNSSHLTREFLKYVSGRSYFRAVSSQGGDKFVTSPPLPIVELILWIKHNPLNVFGVEGNAAVVAHDVRQLFAKFVELR